MVRGASNSLRLAIRWWGVLLAAVVVVLSPSAIATPRLIVRIEQAAPAGDPKAPSPFDAVATAPADADLWIRLVDGRAWLADPSVGRFVTEMSATLVGAIADDPRTSRGAIALAARLGLPLPEAFDRYLGRDARLVARGNGTSLDWCLISRVAGPDIELLAQKLRAIPRAGAMFDVPEEHLAFAQRGEWLVVGRALDSVLFREIAERGVMEAAPHLGETIARTGLDAAALASLGGGRLAVIFRGSQPIAGDTALLLDLRDGHLRGGVRGRYANAPFPDAKPRTVDVSVLGHFKDERAGCLAAELDPIRPTVTPGDAFLVTTFPELVPSPASRLNFSDRRLILVGEVDGAKVTPPLAMRCPAIAVAYEVDDADQATDDQDRMMTALVAGVRRRFAAPPVAGQPPRDEMPPIVIPPSKSQPRRVETSPFLKRFFGDHPLLRATSLNWQTVRGGDHAWQVYATHPEWLEAVSKSLATMPAAPADPREISSAGHCCGVRVASHLRSWTGEAAAFQSDDARGFARGIEFIASIAERFRAIRWTMTMPSDTSLELTIDAEIAPPPTAPAPASR